MWINHLKVAYRLLLRNKPITIIHMVGLSISLSVIGIIMSFIQYETAFDKFHESPEEIFRIVGSYVQGGTDRNESALSTFQLAPQLATRFSTSIDHIARLQHTTATVRSGEDLFFETEIMYADPAITSILTFPMIEGLPSLNGPNQALISRDFALKYFNDTSVSGQTLTVDDRSIQLVGVYDYPDQSHLSPNMVITLATIEPTYPEWVLKNWSGTSHYTYMRLAKGVAYRGLEEQINKEIPNFYPEEDLPEYTLQPVSDIHLSSNLSGELEINGTWATLYYLIGAALLILVIASINYINITSASALKRTKEIGIKKVFGYGKKKIVSQFQIEAIAVSLVAFLLSLFLSEWLHNYLDQKLDLPLGRSLTQAPELIAFLFVIAVVQGFLAGFFTPLLLLRLDIISSLKGKLEQQPQSIRMSFRDMTVTMQFAIAIGLLIVSVTIYRQMVFVSKSDKGYNAEQLISIDLQTQEVAARHDLLKSTLASVPGIENITASGSPHFRRIGGWRSYRADTTHEWVNISTTVIDEDYFKTIGAKILEGRDYDREFPSDATKSYIINESAQKMLGTAGDVNSFLQGWAFSGTEWTEKNAKIIGVVNDFHLTSMHEEIQPAVFSLASEITVNPTWLLARIVPGREEEALSALEEQWIELVPNRPFQYQFIDEALADYYTREMSLLQLITFLSLIGMVISIIGLLGLTMFIIQGRLKEMSIRKVLGASLMQVLSLFLRRFAILIIFANLISWPAAYLINSDWLDNFSYRVTIGWVWYLLVGIIVLTLAFLAISTLVINASRVNPIHTLKDE